MALYVRIESVSVPASAPLGSVVQVSVLVKNLYSAPLGAKVTGYATAVGGFSVELFSAYAGGVNMGPGATAQFTDSFVMPAAATDVWVFTWWYGAGGNWYYDDQYSTVVQLSGGTVAIASSSIPANAVQGSQVTVSVDLRNSSSAPVQMYVAATTSPMGSLQVSPLEVSVPAGATQRFSASFIMPSTSVYVFMQSYYFVGGAYTLGPSVTGTVVATAGTPVGVSVSRPSAYPASGAPGPVQITVPIMPDATFTGTVIMEVHEGSVLGGAGKLMDTQDKTVQFVQGQAANVQFIHNSTLTSQSRRDVIVRVVYAGSIIFNSDDNSDWDDVFYVVETTEKIAFSLSNVTALPLKAVSGDTVKITIPVVSGCTQPQSATAKVMIYEGSFWSGHGNLLSTKTVNFDINPGETYNVVVDDVAVAGTIDLRDVGIDVLVGGAVVASKEWDNVFKVQPGEGEEGEQGEQGVMRNIRVRTYTGVGITVGKGDIVTLNPLNPHRDVIPPATGLSTGDAFQIMYTAANKDQVSAVQFLADWTITKPKGKVVREIDTPSGRTGPGDSVDFREPSLTRAINIDETGDYKLTLVLKADGIEVDRYEEIVVKGAAQGFSGLFGLVSNMIVLMVVMMMMSMMMGFMESPGAFIESAAEKAGKVAKAAQPVVQIFTGKGKEE